MTTIQPQSIDVSTVLDWSESRRVETKNGPRMMSSAKPTEDFWTLWRANKVELKKCGVSLGKYRGEWSATWWQPLSAKVIEAENEAIEASKASDLDIELSCPKGLAYLPYQRAGIAYGMERPNVLIGDEMGLGKTIQAIGIINADPDAQRVLVICPASLRLNWRNELEKWLVRPATVGVVNGGKAADWRHGTNGANIVVINYDVVRKHRQRIDARDWDVVIIDECQMIKNDKAARTRAVYGSKKGGIEPIKSRRTICLSGTPMVNRPVELWTLAQRMDPDGLGQNFFAFAKRYCDAKRNGFGWDFSGNSNLDELQRKLRSTFMVRRLKKDVLTELPPKQRQVITLPANGASEAVAAEAAIHAKYAEQIEGLRDAVELAKAESEAVYAAAVEELNAAISGSIGEIAQARQDVALAKVPYVCDHVERALEGGPVIIFAHHRSVVAKLLEHFGERARAIIGGTKMEDRQAAVEAFQAGDIDVIIGNEAMSTGLTLTRSQHVVCCELPWTPGEQSQREDRAHRIGQTGSVLVQHLVLDGSIDAYMAKQLVSKQNVIDKALDKGLQAIESQTLVPTKFEPSTREVTRTELERVAEELTADQVAAIHEGLRTLAGYCDGAQSEDGCGFSKVDTRIGKSLAGQTELTKRQAALGQRLCRKYRRQLGDLVERCGITSGKA